MQIEAITSARLAVYDGAYSKRANAAARLTDALGLFASSVSIMSHASPNLLTQPDSSPAASSIATQSPPVRLASIDAYRGLVMFLMLAEVLHFGRVAQRRFPEIGSGSSYAVTSHTWSGWAARFMI